MFADVTNIRALLDCIECLKLHVDNTSFTTSNSYLMYTCSGNG